MRVSPISTNYGKNYLKQSNLQNRSNSIKYNTNVTFEGTAGRIIGALGGMALGAGLAAITGGAIIPYFAVAGAAWGHKEEEELKENYKNNKNK